MHTSGEDILTLRMLRSIISWLSHQDSTGTSADYLQTGDEAGTEEDDVNAEFIKFLSQPRSICFHTVICVINYDLSSSIEKFLDSVLAGIRNLFPKCNGFLALRP